MIKILDILTESEDDRLIKRALDIYKAFRHGSFWTLDNKGNPVKVKYILPEKVTRIGVENKEQTYRGRLAPIDVKQAVITIHDILVEYYNEKGKKMEDGTMKFYRKYPFFIEDYKRDFEKRFEVFGIRIIRY
jgi:hypothetical protein